MNQNTQPAADQPLAGASRFALRLRADLAGALPYGAPQLDLPVQLNVNENPYPPSHDVASAMGKAITKSASVMNRYPDREATALRTQLANYLGFGLDADHVWAANGSNEVMVQLLTAFGGPDARLLGFTPTYSMYPEYARNTLTPYVTEPRAKDFTVSADQVLEAIERHQASIVMLATPNNPTGTLTPVAVINEIVSNTDALVIIDEAYQEFTEWPEDSACALLEAHENLAVSRTMSKAFAFAGGRLGYLAASRPIIDACRIVRLPYHLSTPTQVLARVALDHTNQMLDKVEVLRDQIQQLQHWLRDQGLDVVPSQANFCLFGPFADRASVWQGLVDRGVLIRQVGPDGYLRVSAGTPEQMQAFRTALTEVLATEAGRLAEPPTAVRPGRSTGSARTAPSAASASRPEPGAQQ